MEFRDPVPPVYIRPDPDTSSSPAVADGFAGLSTAERAAHAEMLHRAFSIWESKGRPDNSQLADWLEAQAEVSEETRPAGR